MAIVLVCGAECQDHIVSNAAAGISHWGEIALGNGSTPDVVSSPVRTGNYAFKFQASSTGDSMLRKELSTVDQNVGYARLFFRLPVVTTVQDLRLAHHEASGAPRCEVGLNTSGDIFMETFDGSLSTTNNFAPSADTWYGVEFESVAGVGAKWRVWDSTNGWSTSETVADTTMPAVGGTLIGADSAPENFIVYIDDIVLGFGSTAGEHYDDTSTNGRDGYIKRLNPTSDGTHASFTTGDFTNAGGSIASSDTDVWQDLDTDDIAASTDYVESETGATTTEYVEVHFGDETAFDNPTVVQVVAVYESSTGTPEPGNLDISDDGTTWDTMDNPGALSTAGDFNVATPILDVPSDASAWTRTDVNNLRARFYGNGATGADARLMGLALEVEWGTSETIIYTEIKPSDDIATTGWSTTPLYSKIDEDSDSPDGTVISAVAS